MTNLAPLFMINVTAMSRDTANFLQGFEILPLAWDCSVFLLLSVAFIVALIVGGVSKYMSTKPKKTIIYGEVSEVIGDRNSASRNSASFHFEKRDNHKKQHWLLMAIIFLFLGVLLVDIFSETTFVFALQYIGLGQVVERVVYTASLISMTTFFFWNCLVLFAWYALGTKLFFERVEDQQRFKVKHLGKMTFYENLEDRLWEVKEKLRTRDGRFLRYLVGAIIVLLPFLLLGGWCIPLIVFRWIYDEAIKGELSSLIFYQNTIFIFVYIAIVTLFSLAMLIISIFFVHLNVIISKDNRQLEKMFGRNTELVLTVQDQQKVDVLEQHGSGPQRLIHIDTVIEDMINIPTLLPNTFSNGLFKRITILLFATQLAIIIKCQRGRLGSNSKYYWKRIMRLMDQMNLLEHASYFEEL